MKNATTILLLLLLPLACGPSRSTNEPARRKKTRPAETRPAERPTAASPRPAGTVEITAAEAKAKGLPPVAFSLVASGGGWTVGKLPGQGVYLRLSGPPGGPLSFSVETFPNPRASGATLESWIRGRFNKPFRQPLTLGKPGRFTLAGGARPALAFTSGKSMARTAYCAVLVAAKSRPVTELVVLFGHGAPQGQPTCDEIARHNSLAPVLQSFKLVP